MPSLSAWSLGTATLAGNKVAGTGHVSPNGVHNLPIGGHPRHLREGEAVLCQYALFRRSQATRATRLELTEQHRAALHSHLERAAPASAARQAPTREREGVEAF